MLRGKKHAVVFICVGTALTGWWWQSNGTRVFTLILKTNLQSYSKVQSSLLRACSRTVALPSLRESEGICSITQPPFPNVGSTTVRERACAEQRALGSGFLIKTVDRLGKVCIFRFNRRVPVHSTMTVLRAIHNVFQYKHLCFQ